ncbi:MAG: hypothetical protein K6E42_08150 [Synergistes sp.]|nr:hypothetical protein [Synergistes sp.]
MLNIDELLGEGKKIIFGGKEYAVEDPTLETALRIDKMLEDAKDEAEQLKVMGEAIGILVPGFDIRKVPIRAYAAIFKYLMGDEGDEKNAPEAAEGDPTPT